VAGNGTAGFAGDGGAATSAELYGPNGVAFDTAGNMYIGDSYNNRIRKVTPAGLISTVAGNGTYGYTGDGQAATSAAVAPRGIAVDGSGNIYFADLNHNVIREVTASTGIISTVAGNGTAGFAGDGGAATSAELANPFAVAINGGNLYIADSTNNRIREVSASGTISTVAGNGTGGFAGDGGAATSAELYNPVGMAFDSAGNLYIADQYTSHIRKVTPSGTISTVAGGGMNGFIGDGGPATSAALRWPMGVAVDASGNIYIADNINRRVRKVTASTGYISTIAGNGTQGYSGDGGAATSAELSGPAGLAVDTLGNVYFADGPNARIRAVSLITTTPTITWPTPSAIALGTALSGTQLNATATVPGTFVYTPAAGTVLPAGTQTLSVTFTPANTVDYTAATKTVSLTVNQGTADTGTITLTVNGVASATTTYGSGSTPSSVAEGLAAGVLSGSPVNVTAVNDAVYMVAKTTGSASNYAYTLQTTSYNTSSFSQPSFLNPPITGNLDGGANQNAAGQTVYSYSAHYQPNNNLAGDTDLVMGTWNFTYDNLNRLSNATDTQPGNLYPNYCWSYDNWGNRTAQMSSTGAISGGGSTACQTQSSTFINGFATYNSNNQLTGTPQLASFPSGDPDLAGKVIYDGANQYLYDGEGRICAVQQQWEGMTIMTGYLYDANGQRVAKGIISSWSCDPTANGFNATSNYVLGPSGEQLTELDLDSNGTMTWQHTNVFASGALMATYDNAGLHFHLNDWLGTRRAQTDYAGVLEQTCSSLPFGDSLVCTGSTQYPTEHHFTGKERDSESGNDYFGARYYGSSMGRFLSPDPSGLTYADITNPQSLNLYSYALNNPLKNIDPTGLYCFYGGQGDTVENDSDASDYDFTSTGTGECNSSGGQWIDNPSSTVTVSGGGDNGNTLSTFPSDVSQNYQFIPGKGCSAALSTAGQNGNAISNYYNYYQTPIGNAASSNGVAPSLLAAVGVRESGLPANPDVVQGNGKMGRGPFQIDLGQHPGVTEAQAFDPNYSANFAAGLLIKNRATMETNHPSFDPVQLTQATVASYNGRVGSTPDTIDSHTTGHNYGGNVVAIAVDCF
jgi:RHS repeat-associated protein